MYCIDTNIAVEFLRGNKLVIEKITNLFYYGQIYITTISLCELFKGTYLSSKTEEELQILKDFIQSVPILDLKIDSCDEFGKQYARLKKLGKMINEFDLMIACIVKINNMIFITKNKKHFENIGVKLEIL